MSRVPAGVERIIQPPRNNVYTVLAIVGVVVTLLGLLAVFSRAKDIVGGLM